MVADADGPALELGVGTDRGYLEHLAADLDVDGTDVSRGMLDVLQENADARGLTPSVQRGDVLDGQPDRQYDVVYAPNRTFNHLTTVDDQLAALRTVRDALAVVPKRQFELLFDAAGFERAYGDFDRDPLEAPSQERV